MQEVQYYLSFILYIGLLINLAWITIFLLWKTRIRSKAKGKFDGYLMFVSLFFLFVFIGSLIRFCYMYIYTLGDINTFFVAFFDPTFRQSNPIYAKLVIIYGLLVMYAMGCITFAVEHYVYQKTRHVLSIAAVIYLSILSPLVLILPYEHSITTMVVNFPFVLAFITIMIVMIIYVKVAWQSSGIRRRKAIFLLLGFLLFFGGLAINSQIIMIAIGLDTLNTVWTVALVFNIASLIVFYGSYVEQSD